MSEPLVLHNREIVVGIPPGGLGRVSKITAYTQPTIVVYGTHRLRLEVGESATVEDGKLVKVGTA